MKDTYNLSEFGSFTRARQIGVTMLFALTLAGPLASMAATPQLISFDLSKTTMVRNGNDSITATVTISCPPGYAGYEWGPALTSANGFVLMPSPGVAVYCGDAPTSTSAPFGISPYVFGGTSPVTDTITATVPQGNSISRTITINPIFPTLTLSPGSLTDGSGQTVTATISTGVQVYNGAGNYNLTSNANGLEVPSGVGIPDGKSSFQFQISQGTAVSTNTLVTITATPSSPVRIYGANSASATILVRPAGAVSPADIGPAACVVACGHPINLTNGNVWIQERDYSVPGLGGGLGLSRVWNSLRFLANPPALAGMFGLGWQSTYEEQLTLQGSQSLIYWRGDGSGWTFTYNSALNSYSLSSPPNERAQLVMNPATGASTLTFADGTQKVFNSQNLLAAVIDRNNNQTTITYDSYNRIASVSSPGGSTLSFTYGDPNNFLQATTAQDSVGVVATYTYDSTSQLTKVTYPDGSALNFTYDPNSSMILSVTDSQGKLLESHTYDAQDRGLTSARAYGVDSVSLSY
jgi:YD repeat-containing protein